MNVPSGCMSAVGICSRPVLESANCARAGAAPSKVRTAASRMICIFFPFIIFIASSAGRDKLFYSPRYSIVHPG